MVIKLGEDKKEIAQMLSLGADNVGALDRLCGFLLALAPLLQHYKGVYENAGFTVLLICAPILAVRLFYNSNIGNANGKIRMIPAMIPILIFEIYTALIHSPSIMRILYVFFLIYIFICIASGCANLRYFFAWSIRIASVNTVLIVIQYISYYIFNKRLELRPLSLLVDEDSIWIRHAQSSSGTGLYRTGGAFLEPSHFFLFCLPLLCLLLLSPRMTEWRKRHAIILSAGLMLTTSGFGIFLTIALWGLYILIYKDNDDNVNFINQILKPKKIIIFIALLILLVIAYSSIPIFQHSINRIFSEDGESSNAIDGRIRLASNYVKGISGNAVIIGQSGVTSTLEFNLSGFFATYIKWGVIGLALTYWFYGQGLFKLKKAYFWMSAIIIVISFFTAHTHGTFYLLYFVIFLMNGYYEKIQYSY